MLGIQEVINASFAGLAPGVQVVITGRKGWEIVLRKAEDGMDLIHRNPAGEDKEKFFRYSTVGNPYGAGMIEQEPSLGVPLREIGIPEDGTLVGALVLDGAGKVAERFSWSSLVHMKKGEFRIGGDGALVVNGEPKGFLKALFLADKNRIKGHVGVFVPERTDQVKVLEMETLLLASI